MDEMFPLPPSHLWLIAGAILVALEAFGIPGIGLLFGGLAAFLTALLIEGGVVAQENYILQFGCWFALTVLVGLALWKPLKKWRGSDAPEYHNMLGSTVTVCDGPLMKGKTGQALWSGTRMNAELASDAGVEMIAEGETALIAAVDGNILKLKPR